MRTLANDTWTVIVYGPLGNRVADYNFSDFDSADKKAFDLIDGDRGTRQVFEGTKLIVVYLAIDLIEFIYPR